MCKMKSNEKVSECKHFKEFMDAQIEFFQEHLETHAYFNHISDKNEALIDFIKQTAWINREWWCKYVCKENCDLWMREIPFGKLKPKKIV